METMTPSSVNQKDVTEKQIGKAVSNYRALLEKHSVEFEREAVQAVLGQPELASDMFAVFRRRVEALANMVVRVAKKVIRTLTPKQVLDNTGRVQYVDDKVVQTMPKGEGDEAEVIFFKPDLSERGGSISDDDLEKEYALRGLIPADAYSLAKVNQDDPSFADEKPNGTHWKDAKGNWCFIAFARWGVDERRVDVVRFDDGWGVGWWFAGLRKPVLET